MRSRSAARILRPWLFAACALGPALPLQAHELGAVVVRGSFSRAARYRLEVTIGLDHLPPAERVAPGDPSARRTLIDRALEGITLEFDQGAGRPEVAVLAARGENEIAAALDGAIPPGSTSFRFRSELALGQLLLELTNEGDERPLYQWLEPGESSAPFSLAHPPPLPSTGAVIVQYAALGYTHILPHGLDHILFVCGLFLLSRQWKPLLWQVTAFTLAHSITLALALYDVLRLPSKVVEPLIALSIAYVAIENLFLDHFRAWRVLLVFAFGLLHGMGFASVLTELGLPRTQFVPALLSFNLGVELGQLSVLLIALVLVALPFARRDWYRARVTVPASVAVALVGLYWTVQRVVAP